MNRLPCSDITDASISAPPGRKGRLHAKAWGSAANASAKPTVRRPSLLRRAIGHHRPAKIDPATVIPRPVRTPLDIPASHKSP